MADEGYHKSEVLAECEEWGCRTYIPEPERKKRTWTDKPESWRGNGREPSPREGWEEQAVAEEAERGGGAEFRARGRDGR